MNNKSTLTICIIAKNDICVNTTVCIMNIYNDIKLNSLVKVNINFATKQSDLPKTRSEQVTDWYLNSFKDDYFMFIDSDQIFTTTDIIKSLEFCKNYDIVCGAYVKGDGNLTLEPKNLLAFHKNKEGELWYGSTGFMMFSYSIIDILAKQEEPVFINLTKKSYKFFYHRIAEEKQLKINNLWLGEDFSFCWFARSLGAKIYGYISPTIGHIIPKDCYVQILPTKKWDDKTIVIYCGITLESWSPENINTGVGGSELAIIKLAPLWVKNGYKVYVYCKCDKPGIYEGVNYTHTNDFCISDYFNILIVWRDIEFLKYINIDCKKCIIDLHDIIIENDFTENVIKNAYKICVKSKYHASMLKSKNCNNKIEIIPNGGAFEATKLKKDKNYLIYSSSYDRGLVCMLKWGWPKIKKEIPDAYLNIFYGWNGFDLIKPESQDRLLYKKTVMELLEQDGVKEYGRISREKLLLEKQKANIHYYIGDFQEIDCISVRESASLGAIPVVSKQCLVFEEKDYCIKIEGDPHTKETHEKGADVIIELLKNKEKTEKYRKNMKISEMETWENVSKRWIELFKNDS